MNSQIFVGETWHVRSIEAKHAFRYPLYFFGVDLSELDELGSKSWLFSYNRWGVFSLHDRDFISNDPASLTEKITRLLSSEELSGEVSRVMLFTMPRYFGYVFNPVSFYLCEGDRGECVALIAEVNNTFGEKHVYVLTESVESDCGRYRSFRFPKRFYVSPFFKVSGQYEVLARQEGAEFDIRVNIIEGDEVVFRSGLVGEGERLSAAALMRCFVRFPITGWLTMTRIHWQALVLRVLKSIRPFSKPDRAAASTVTPSNRGIWAAARLTLVKKLAREERPAEVVGVLSAYEPRSKQL